MVRLQLLTGMRSGELVIIRAADIDRTGAVWVYRPVTHKSAHKGKVRAVPLGPKAQELLAPFLERVGDDAAAYLFSPKISMKGHREALRKTRKSPVQPSQRNRSKKRPRRCPGDRYDSHTYCRAIARACEAARVEPWHPHQIRHAYATAIRQSHGLEAAQVLLGHASAKITEIYAEANGTLGQKVAAEVG